MNKKTKWAITGALAAGTANAILNAIKQYGEIQKNPGQSFDLNRVFIAGGKGLLWGSVGGFALGSIADYNNSLQKPEDTDAFLHNLVLNIKLDKSDRKYLRQEEKANLLISLIKKQYQDKLASEPLKIGSTVKETALKDKSDIDLGVTFKRNSFRSTRYMFDTVFSYLNSLTGYHSITSVRDQHKSIGIYFKVSNDAFKIDVVPQKRTRAKGKNQSGYLFLNDSNWWSDNSSYTKTNFATLNNIPLSPIQKKITIILKHWKLKYDLPLGSHLLENLIIDAYKYNKNSIPKKLSDKVIMVLRHIAENIEVAAIRSAENSNNILTDISTEDKATIVTACKSAVNECEYQPNNIIKIFRQE